MTESQPKSNAVNTTAYKRLQQDLIMLLSSRDEGISAQPDGDNILNWSGTIEGPSGTVYEGHTYKVAFRFQPTYPFKPPIVVFHTPCFHPNVDILGLICMDILTKKWSPLLDVRCILLSIQSLLGDANVESPLNYAAAALWGNQVEFKKRADDYYHKRTKN